MGDYRSEAFIYYGPADVRRGIREFTCGPTDLVIRVLASARCGTDKTIFRKGHYKVDPHAPIILGHELVGEIVEVGPKVKFLTMGIGYLEGSRLTSEYLDFTPGEKVTLQSRIARYKNGLMLLTDPITILSFYIDGGYAQYLRVPQELIQSGSVLRILPEISDEEGVLVEPAACALESIFASPRTLSVDEDGRHIFRSGVKPGGRTCVIGSGTVSLIYARLCQLDGSAEVRLIVRSEEKARLAQQVLGGEFKVIIFPPYDRLPIEEKEKAEDHLVQRITEETGGHLFDDVISANPDPHSQRLMLKLCNPEGYAVAACFGGTHEKVDHASFDLLHYRYAKVIGTSGCSTRTMEKVISLLGQKKLSLKGFVSPRHFTLRDNPEEFFTTTARGLKPVLYPWE